MYPFLLPEVFGFTIPLYDVFIILGIIAMLFYAAKRFDEYNEFTKQETNRLLVLIIASLIIALGFSYVIDGIFHTIKEGTPTFGSISFLGALIGGVIGFAILYRLYFDHQKYSIKPVINTIIVGVVLAHAFGRIGCFFAGCCHGIPTESYFGMVFQYGEANHTFGEQALVPTQLMESAFLFALFFGLHYLQTFKKKELEVYLIAYGLFRILIEFVRGDNRGVFVRLFETQYNVFPTPSQFLSLIMIIFAVVLILTQNNRKIIT